jgi:hypothetical protein
MISSTFLIALVFLENQRAQPIAIASEARWVGNYENPASQERVMWWWAQLP